MCRVLINLSLQSNMCWSSARAGVIPSKLRELCADPAASANTHLICESVLALLSRSKRTPIASCCTKESAMKQTHNAVHQVAVHSTTSASNASHVPSMADERSKGEARSGMQLDESGSTCCAEAVQRTQPATPQAPLPDEHASSQTSDESCESAKVSAKSHKRRRARERSHTVPAVTDSGSADSDALTAEFDAILARRLRAGKLEYLVRWRDHGAVKPSEVVKAPKRAKGEAKRAGAHSSANPAAAPQHEPAAEWLSVERIHDPYSVVAHDRGHSHAAAYADWAWALDPNGAGWSNVPLKLVDRDTEERRRQTKPSCWPRSITYTPFLLWETSSSTELRLSSARYARSPMALHISWLIEPLLMLTLTLPDGDNAFALVGTHRSRR